MSTLTLTVTKGYTWPLTGTILLDPTKLNLLATPVVTGALTGVIQAEDMRDDSVPARSIQAGAVELAKLAAEVAAFLPVPDLTAVDDTDGTGQVTIQVQDANGNNLANRYLMRVWTAASEFGVPASITGFSPTTGTTMQTITANAALIVQTNASGQIVMDFNNGAAGTRYVMVEINNKVYSVRVTITT